MARGWHELVLSHPPRFLSSRRCMKSSPVRGRHLLLPETVSVGPPPSPPLMAVWLRVTRASPLCKCALTPPGWGSHLTGKAYQTCGEAASALHAMVLLQVCTRMVMIRKFFRNFVPRRTTRYMQRRLQRSRWVMRCPLWWSRNAISGCVWPT